MIKLPFVLIFGIVRILLVLAALALLVAIIALPFVLIAKLLRALRHPPKPPPPPPELYIAKETTMPAFLSVISYTLLVALMLGVSLGWIGGL